MRIPIEKFIRFWILNWPAKPQNTQNDCFSLCSDFDACLRIPTLCCCFCKKKFCAFIYLYFQFWRRLRLQPMPKCSDIAFGCKPVLFIRRCFLISLLSRIPIKAFRARIENNTRGRRNDTKHAKQNEIPENRRNSQIIKFLCGCDSPGECHSRKMPKNTQTISGFLV